jgi:hypothetical protein
MTNEKILAIIEKLSRLTVERGATEAEAAVAQQKIVSLRAQLTTVKTTARVYGNPWYQTVRYDSVEQNEEWERRLTPQQKEEWYRVVESIYRAAGMNAPPRPKRK